MRKQRRSLTVSNLHTPNKRSRGTGEILNPGYIYNCYSSWHSYPTENVRAAYQAVVFPDRYQWQQQQIPLIRKSLYDSFLALQILKAEYTMIEIIPKV